MVTVSRMGAKKDTRIVEFIVLLGVVNGFLYSLKFNPVNAFFNEVTSSVSAIIAAIAPGFPASSSCFYSSCPPSCSS